VCFAYGNRSSVNMRTQKREFCKWLLYWFMAWNIVTPLFMAMIDPHVNIAEAYVTRYYPPRIDVYLGNFLALPVLLGLVLVSARSQKGRKDGCGAKADNR